MIKDIVEQLEEIHLRINDVVTYGNFSDLELHRERLLEELNSIQQLIKD